MPSCFRLLRHWERRAASLARGDTTPAKGELRSAAALVARYGARTGRDVSRIDWYDVFSRWKLAIVLEGSYAKFLRGESKKPIHEHFGRQADQLLESAVAIAEGRG